LLVIFLFLVSACALDISFLQPALIPSNTPEPGPPTASPQPSATPTLPPTATPTETPLPTATETPPFSLHESLFGPLAVNAPYNEDFLQLIQASQDCGNAQPGGAVTMLVYDVTGQRPLVAISEEDQMPVASAFKGPLLIYALSEIDSEIWTSVPAEYWSQSGKIPDEYLPLLREHWILSRIYDMIVDSSNWAAGVVLDYVNDHSETDLNALEQFNTWSQEVIGTSPSSGLWMWEDGPTVGVVDPNYTYRKVTDWCGRAYSYPNTYSAKDLALYYAWLYDRAPEDLRETATDLLSIVAGNPNQIESSAISLGGDSYSKGGIFGGGKSSFVWVDAGLIVLEHQTYLVATTSVNASKLLRNIFTELRAIIQTESDYDPITLVNSLTRPDWAAALEEVSKAYLTDTHYEANKVAQEIDYLASAIEDASLMCGPLAGTILQDVGKVPKDFDMGKFWLGDPPRDGRPWKFFDEDEYHLFAFRSRDLALNKFNFKAFPLLPGDVLYTHGGTGTHLFVVVKVDEQGRAYSVNNNCIGKNNCPIQEVLMYDLSNPGVGDFYTAYQEGWFRTGQLGFDLLRSKDYPQIFPDWYFRYALEDWGS
jgi:hypothetical protein